jgi:hypothetical protein
MTNDMQVTIAIVVVAALLIGVAWLLTRRRRTAVLRERFGPEYDHVVHSRKTTAEAERELEQRARRVQAFSLRPLSHEEVDRFEATWRTVQARFVDDPRSTLLDADRLIADVMRERGYPVENPDRRLEDLSVEHARVVEHYRAGREIVVRHERGEASTEDLRQAMIHFRALFEELVTAEPHHVRRAS